MPYFHCLLNLLPFFVHKKELIYYWENKNMFTILYKLLLEEGQQWRFPSLRKKQGPFPFMGNQGTQHQKC